MRIFLLIVFLILTVLYGFQLWSKHRASLPPKTQAVGGASAPSAPLAPPTPPDLTPQRLALEKALSGVRISSVIAGAAPIAQIGGRSYQIGEKIAVPGSTETVSVRAIGDGFVLYSTPYHPKGFRVDITREQLRTAPTTH